MKIKFEITKGKKIIPILYTPFFLFTLLLMYKIDVYGINFGLEHTDYPVWLHYGLDTLFIASNLSFFTFPFLVYKGVIDYKY